MWGVEEKGEATLTTAEREFWQPYRQARPEPTFQFRGETLRLHTATYAKDGCISVMALDATGFPFATLSVHITESCGLPKGAFYLKDWSENADLAGALIAQGVIRAVPVPPVLVGHVLASAYRLT